MSSSQRIALAWKHPEMSMLGYIHRKLTQSTPTYFPRCINTFHDNLTFQQYRQARYNHIRDFSHLSCQR